MLTSDSVTRLVCDIPVAPGNSAPSEFRIFSFGTTDTTKGAYAFDSEAAATVMQAAQEYGNRLTLDYEHQALNDPPMEAPSAGTYSLDLRADGLWATDVRWTPKASAYLSNKEYLYFSPAFLHDEKGRPKRLLNVALTNIPATKRMQPLVAAKQSTEVHMKTVLGALNLKESASEADAFGAVVRLGDEHRKLLSAVGKDSADEAVGVIVALKAKSEKYDVLATELETVKAEKLAAEATALLDEAVKDGRVAHAKRADFETLHKECGIKALRTCLSALPKASEPALPPSEKPEAPKASGYSDEALKMMSRLGVKPEDITTHKQKLREQRGLSKEQE